MIHTIDGIISAACGSRTGVIAVAAAHDQPVIEAVEIGRASCRERVSMYV